MAGDGTEMSDVRNAVALFQEVIQELRDDALAEFLPFIPTHLNMTQLARMMYIIDERLKNNLDFHNAIDRLGRCDESRGERFQKVALGVLQHDASWERIVLLFYVAARLTLKPLIDVPRQMVENCASLIRWILDHGRWILELDNSLFVRVILRCTLNFLCTKLLSWIHERGRQDCIHVNRLSAAVQNASEGLRNDPEFQDAIEAVIQVPGSRLENVNQVAQNAFDRGMTWERIAVLNYVFGVMAIRMDHWSVRDILRWTINLFHPYRLSLAHESGRQISSSSEPATASVSNSTSLTSSSSGLILTFITGIALGSFITWRVTRSL